MTRPAASSPVPAPHLAGGPALRREPGILAALIGGAVLCLALITLVHPGATRMHASPWSLAYINALLLPTIVLALRAFNPTRPIALPAREWLVFAVAMAVVMLGSALASPYRAQSLLWSAPLLAAVVVFFLIFDWLNSDPSQAPGRRERVRNTLLALFAVISVVSLVLWSRQVLRAGVGEIFATRNLYPLGHPSYT